MTSPRAARRAAALAAAAAAVVVVVLPGRPAALAAPVIWSFYNYRSSNSDSDSVYHRPAANVNYMGAAPPNHEHMSYSDFIGAAPSNHERMSYSPQPDEPLPKITKYMKNRINKHWDLAKAAMEEAAQLIRGRKLNADRYKKFFEPKLSSLLTTAREMDKIYASERQYYLSIHKNNEDARAKLGHLPSNYKRLTVAQWIESFAIDRCRASERIFGDVDDFDERHKINFEDRQDLLDPHHPRRYWQKNGAVMDLKKLVDAIRNMAIEFVEMLQADGKSTEQRQSKMYEKYTEDFWDIVHIGSTA